MEIKIDIKNFDLKNLKKYIEELGTRTTNFLQELTDSGIPIIDSSIATAQGDSDKTHSCYVTVESNNNVFTATLNVQGRDIAFLEFGAGYFYNGSTEHPKASEMGMGVGTYPGQTHAFDVGWWYLDEMGEKRYSHGTEARFPLYRAKEKMVNTFFDIAKKHF